jgi:hypothetical protein
MREMIDWVVAEATPGEVQHLAEQVHAYLLAEGIVSPSVQRSGNGRTLLPPGPRAPEWSRHVWLALDECGVEVVQGSRAFPSGSGDPRALACPSCGQPQPAGSLPWKNAVAGWQAHPSRGELTCEACGSTACVTRWRFLDAPWAFGQLGVGFRHWSIDDPLHAGLSLLLGRPCRLIRQHL